MKILIIEDEPALVTGLRDAFEHNGFSVASAADGETGLDFALSNEHDLIILDLMLPEKRRHGSLPRTPQPQHLDAGHHAHCAQRRTGARRRPGTWRR